MLYLRWLEAVVSHSRASHSVLGTFASDLHVFLMLFLLITIPPWLSTHLYPVQAVHYHILPANHHSTIALYSSIALTRLHTITSIVLSMRLYFWPSRGCLYSKGYVYVLILCVTTCTIVGSHTRAFDCMAQDNKTLSSPSFVKRYSKVTREPTLCDTHTLRQTALSVHK
jgi:hypothetical protein